MRWVLIIFVVLVVVVAGAFLLRLAWKRHGERRAKRREYREFLQQIRGAVEEFEKTQDFDEQIRVLADIGRYCANALRLFPEHPEIMQIDRACQDERRKLAQHWAVAESGRLMKLVEESTNLRAKAGRADQVAESLKVISRLLFPHDQITNAMRSVVQYQETLEGTLELPEAEREAAAAAAWSLLDSYFEIMEELKKENQELARVPWQGERVRQVVAQLEKL